MKKYSEEFNFILLMENAFYGYFVVYLYNYNPLRHLSKYLEHLRLMKAFNAIGTLGDRPTWTGIAFACEIARVRRIHWIFFYRAKSTAEVHIRFLTYEQSGTRTERKPYELVYVGPVHSFN